MSPTLTSSAMFNAVDDAENDERWREDAVADALGENAMLIAVRADKIRMRSIVIVSWCDGEGRYSLSGAYFLGFEVSSEKKEERVQFVTKLICTYVSLVTQHALL